jgi:hypothetical protein
MTFQLLATHQVFDGSKHRAISVYAGDLSNIPLEHAVDLLVLSAFPDDYIPTRSSLIGALHRQGLSVSDLAKNKEFDLRQACQFWLSKPVVAHSRNLNIGRIACFEPTKPTDAATTVGAVFRGLFPFLDDNTGSVVAMSVLAAGDQGESWEAMFDRIVETAEHWMSRGLAINELKIVIRDSDQAQLAAKRLSVYNQQHAHSGQNKQSVSEYKHDVFLSFSSSDGDGATLAKQVLTRRSDVRSVFDFRHEIPKGASWQAELDVAIAQCRTVVALITPAYEKSPECQEEIMQARLRHKHERQGVLFPVYWRSLQTPVALWLRTINYADCREQDASGLESALANMRL